MRRFVPLVSNIQGWKFGFCVPHTGRERTLHPYIFCVWNETLSNVYCNDRNIRKAAEDRIMSRRPQRKYSGDIDFFFHFLFINFKINTYVCILIFRMPSIFCETWGTRKLRVKRVQYDICCHRQIRCTCFEIIELFKAINILISLPRNREN